MAIARSKVTARGQVSVPAQVRRRLGIGPGSVIAWDAEGDNIVVRRAGRYSSLEIHRALFGGRAPKTGTLRELKDGMRRYIRKRHVSR